VFILLFIFVYYESLKRELKTKNVVSAPAGTRTRFESMGGFHHTLRPRALCANSGIPIEQVKTRGRSTDKVKVDEFFLLLFSYFCYFSLLKQKEQETK
jgi:hypothetical protein